MESRDAKEDGGTGGSTPGIPPTLLRGPRYERFKLAPDEFADPTNSFLVPVFKPLGACASP